jgi:hypothetical protein
VSLHQLADPAKWSPDPDFQEKADRVLSLYRDQPPDGPVVCFDEMGPIQLIPHQGSGWAPEKLPERLRATARVPRAIQRMVPRKSTTEEPKDRRVGLLGSLELGDMAAVELEVAGGR